MGQRARLQLAELDEQRGVHDVDVRRHGQLEQFSEDHLREGRKEELHPPFRGGDISLSELHPDGPTSTMW